MVAPSNVQPELIMLRNGVTYTQGAALEIDLSGRHRESGENHIFEVEEYKIWISDRASLIPQQAEIRVGVQRQTIDNTQGGNQVGAIECTVPEQVPIHRAVMPTPLRILGAQWVQNYVGEPLFTQETIFKARTSEGAPYCIEAELINTGPGHSWPKQSTRSGNEICMPIPRTTRDSPFGNNGTVTLKLSLTRT